MPAPRCPVPHAMGLRYIPSEPCWEPVLGGTVRGSLGLHTQVSGISDLLAGCAVDGIFRVTGLFVPLLKESNKCCA